MHDANQFKYIYCYFHNCGNKCNRLGLQHLNHNCYHDHPNDDHANCVYVVITNIRDFDKCFGDKHQLFNRLKFSSKLCAIYYCNSK